MTAGILPTMLIKDMALYRRSSYNTNEMWKFITKGYISLFQTVTTQFARNVSDGSKHAHLSLVKTHHASKCMPVQVTNSN